MQVMVDSEDLKIVLAHVHIPRLDTHGLVNQEDAPMAVTVLEPFLRLGSALVVVENPKGKFNTPVVE